MYLKENSLTIVSLPISYNIGDERFYTFVFKNEVTKEKVYIILDNLKTNIYDIFEFDLNDNITLSNFFYKEQMNFRYGQYLVNVYSSLSEITNLSDAINLEENSKSVYQLRVVISKNDIVPNNNIDDKYK